MSHKKILYVGGLDEKVDQAILHAAFIPFGDIKEVQIPLDHATQKNRGFGFVDFEEREDAAAALDNMNNSELYGRVLKGMDHVDAIVRGEPPVSPDRMISVKVAADV